MVAGISFYFQPVLMKPESPGDQFSLFELNAVKLHCNAFGEEKGIGLLILQQNIFQQDFPEQRNIHPPDTDFRVGFFRDLTGDHPRQIGLDPGALQGPVSSGGQSCQECQNNEYYFPAFFNIFVLSKF